MVVGKLLTCLVLRLLTHPLFNMPLESNNTNPKT